MLPPGRKQKEVMPRCCSATSDPLKLSFHPSATPIHDVSFLYKQINKSNRIKIFVCTTSELHARRESEVHELDGGDVHASVGTEHSLRSGRTVLLCIVLPVVHLHALENMPHDSFAFNTASPPKKNNSKAKACIAAVEYAIQL